MRKLLNTLFITSENAKLSLDGETVYIEIEQKKVGQFPLHTIESIYCFSYLGATPALMGACARKGVHLSFYSPYGRFLCSVAGAKQGNVLLRKQQFRISESDELCLPVAKNMITGKIFNSRWSLGRTCRDHPLRIDESRLENAVTLLKQSLEAIRKADNLDSVRGIEGEAAQVYFHVFNDMIINQKEDFLFDGRSRRPPLDPVNALLSFGYSLLTNDCAAALEGVGLDSYVGFLHRDRPGRKSLALDLVEEFRPVLVDRFVISMINNREIHKDDFLTQANGAVIMTDSGRKAFLKKWQEHKREEIRHPYLKEKIRWGLVPHIQALLLSRYIRGDLDEYPPFLWK